MPRAEEAASAAASRSCPSRLLRALVAMLTVFATLVALAVTAPLAHAADIYDIKEQGWVNSADSGIQVCAQGGSCKPWPTDGTGEAVHVSIGDTVKAELAFTVGNDTSIKAGDTLTYPLPANLNFDDIGVRPFKDATGRTRGTWYVRGGEVVIEFSEDAGSNLSGFVTVEGRITKDSGAGTGGGALPIEFPGFVTITPQVEPMHRLDVHKSAAVAVPSDPSLFEFTLEVISEGSNANVTLDDAMGSLLTFQPGSIKVCSDPNGTVCLPAAHGSWSVEPDADGHGFTLTIDSMNDETYYVKYWVSVDRGAVIAASKTDTAENNAKITNKVAWSSDENTERNTTERQLRISSTWWTYKYGQLGAARDTVAWTIEVGPGYDNSWAPDGTTATIRDLLGSNTPAPQDDVTVTIYPRTSPYGNPVRETTMTWAELAEGAALPLVDGQLAGRYVFTYTTPAEAAGDSTQTDYRNTVEVTPTDGTGTISATGTVTRRAAELAKAVLSAPTDSGPTVQWRTTVTLFDPMSSEGVADGRYVLTDTLDGNHTVTPEGIGLTVCTNDSCTNKLEAGTDYELEIADDGKSFTVRPLWAMPAGTLTLRYSTTLDADGATWPVTNTVHFFDLEQRAEYRRTTADNMDKWEMFYYDPGSASVPVDRGLARFVLRVHDIDPEADTVSVTDTFDARMEFVEGSMKAKRCNDMTSRCQVTLDGVEARTASAGDTQSGTPTQVVFTIRRGTDAFTQATTSEGLLIVYDLAGKLGTESFNLANRAVISVDGTAQPPDIASRWYNPPTRLDKNQTYDTLTAPNVTYTIHVNSAAQTINDGEAYRLTDQLPESMSLVQGTLSIKDLDDPAGGQVEGASSTYDPETRRLVITMPDRTAALITYEALVLLKPGESLAGKGVNTVRLTGEHATTVQDGTTLTGEVIRPVAGITDSRYGLQVVKFVDGATDHPLAGAVFAIEELAVDQRTDTTAWTSTGSAMKTSELVSGVDGATDVYTQVKANTIYRISEVKAPAGYTATAEPVLVVFPAEDTGNPETNAGLVAADYQAVTVDGRELQVAALDDGTPLQRFQWWCSNASQKKASLSIAKTDGSLALPGARLELRNGKGDVVDSWTSDGTAHRIDGLVPDRYVLHEAAAPDGHLEASDIAVTVGSDGTVTVGGHDVRDADGIGQVTMVDPPQTTTVTARKAWDDDDDRDGLRKDVTFMLYRRVAGREWTPVTGSMRTIARNAAAGTTVSWTGLPVMQGGQAVSYEPREIDVPAGYTASQPALGADGTYVITNTHTPATTQVSVHKNWVLRERDGNAPDAVTVELLANGASMDPKRTVELSADGNWRGDFTGLPVHEHGIKIVYTVREDVPAGYDVAVSGTPATGYELTNTWRPTGGAVRFAKRTPTGQPVAGARLVLERRDDTGAWTTEHDGDGDWEWTSEDTPHELLLDAGTYRFRETAAPDGFTLSDEAREGTVFGVAIGDDGTVTLTDADGNTLPDVALVLVNEHGTRPLDIAKETLGGSGRLAGAVLRLTGITVDGEPYDSGTWTSGDEPRRFELKPGDYRLHELDAPAGYELAADIVFTLADDGSVSVADGGCVPADGVPLLTMADEPKSVPLSVSKVEVGGSEELPGATFTLDGTDLSGATVHQEWTSTAVPRTFLLRDGTYTLTETAAPAGYDPADPIGFTIVDGAVAVDGEPLHGSVLRVENARIPVTAIGVEKQWSDGNDRDGLRPTTVQVRLKRNNVNCDQDEAGDYCGTGSIERVLVTLGGEHGWSHTFTGLRRNDPDTGKPYSYTVDELIDATMSSQYHVSVSQTPRQDGIDYRMVNIHEPESIEIALDKEWLDDADRDGLRPEAIGIRVTGTSRLPTSTDLGDESAWADIPVTMIEYPDANGYMLTAGDDGQWSWTLENLPKRNIYGNPYTYTLEELPLTTDGKALEADGSNRLRSRTDATADAYESTVETVPVDGNPNEGGECRVPQDGAIERCAVKVTNTHEPETTSLTVRKTWDDGHDGAGLRPGQLTVWLLGSIWPDSAQEGGEYAADGAADSAGAVGGSDAGSGTDTASADGSEDADSGAGAAAAQPVAYLPGWPSPQTADGTCSGPDYGQTLLATALGRSCIVLTADGPVGALGTQGDGGEAAADGTDAEGASPSMNVAGSKPTTTAGDGAGDADGVDDADAAGADADTWPAYTFEGLPKYYRGQEIRYTVTESFEGELAKCNGVRYEPSVHLAAASDGQPATATITNSLNAFNLPSTGGAPNHAIVVALAVVCAAMLALGVQLQRLRVPEASGGGRAGSVPAAGRNRHEGSGNRRAGYTGHTGHARHARPRRNGVK